MMLAKRNETGIIKAVDERKLLLQTREVMDKLNPIEKGVLNSTTKKAINLYSDDELIKKITQLVEFLYIDLGIKTKPTQYEVTRFYTIIKNYYNIFTLGEIKTAFELAMLGELDLYLPKDKNGHADRGHYQSFSVDYVTKILGAYKHYRSRVLIKAYGAIKEPERKTTQHERVSVKNRIFARNKNLFLRYKYLGKFELKFLESNSIYSKFIENGLANEVFAGAEEKKQALLNYVYSGAHRHINKFKMEEVKKKGTDHEEIILKGVNIAMTKEVKDCFDYLIEEEIQIDNYLK